MLEVKILKPGSKITPAIFVIVVNHWREATSTKPSFTNILAENEFEARPVIS